MKRIWAVSDVHGNLQGLGRDNAETNPAGCDLAVFAGDIAPLSWAMDIDEQVRWWETEFMAWVTQFPNVEFALVPGNHDLLLRDDPNAVRGILPRNCHLLIDEGAEIAGLKVYGTPWVPVINHRWAFEGRSLVLRERFSHIPKGIDVLVTHTPPFVRGHDFDVSLQSLGSPRHYGSLDLATAIRINHPKMAFFGHIHSGDHAPNRIWGTRCWNVSRVDEGYRVAYDPAIVEV